MPNPGHPSRRHEAPPPPRGALLPPPKRAMPARKSVRCGVGDRPPYPHPTRPRKKGSRPRLHAQKMGCGGRESAPPRTPLTEARDTPPPGRLPATPQRATPSRRSVRRGVGDGSAHPHPPRRRKKSSGPQLHAQRTGGRGRESAQPQTPLTEPRAPPPPPRAPSCRPRSAKWQMARARAVGLVTAPHVRTPAPTRTPAPQKKRAVGPGCTSRGRVVGGGRVPNPGRPSRRHEAPPPGATLPPPRRATPPRKTARHGVGDGPPHPHPPRPRKKGSGRRLHTQRTGGRGRESAQTRTPLTEPRPPPPPGAPSCNPPSAQR